MSIEEGSMTNKLLAIHVIGRNGASCTNIVCRFRQHKHFDYKKIRYTTVIGKNSTFLLIKILFESYQHSHS